MPVRNQTQWAAPSGTGYITPSTGGNITTLSASPLVTLSGSNLIVDSQVYQPKYDTAWAKATKGDTTWQNGSVVNVGSENIADNLGNLFTDNLGNFIVTTSTYDTPKNQTTWTASGA